MKKVTHLDFTWEAREELIRKEEFEEGHSQRLSQGLSQGILRGKMESIIELLKDLGEIPEELQTKIMSCQSLKTPQAAIAEKQDTVLRKFEYGCPMKVLFH